MPMIILHDLNDEEILVNTDNVTAAKRRAPDENSVIKTAFTKLFFTNKSMEAMGFPDVVKETPAEIVKIASKA